MNIIQNIEKLELIPDKYLDKYLGMPTLFSLIVIFQGCFGGMGIVQTPTALTNAINHPVFRALFVCAIAYTATSDIENAIFTTFIFFVFLHLIRTEEERKQVPTYF